MNILDVKSINLLTSCVCVVVSGELHRVRPLSSSPLPYAVFAPTLFEFDPIKSSSPLD